MAFTIKSEKFKQESFHKDSDEWYIFMNQIDAIQNQYKFAQSTKELFYGLASHGETSTVVDSRAYFVAYVLSDKGFDVELIKTEII